VSALAGPFARHADILTPRFRYLLGGSVRNSASTLRVSAHLVDAATDTYLWADHFDCVFDGAFEAQDKVAEQLVGAIVPRLERLEIEQAKRAPDEALDARDCTQGWLRFFEQNSCVVKGNSYRG
jgi:hypothetical protein